jgi:hypothetical protein
VDHQVQSGAGLFSAGGRRANYLTTAALTVALTPLHSFRAIPLGLWLLASASGVGFVLTYLLLIPALRHHGVATPTAAVQVSMVVPVFPAPPSSGTSE